MSKTASSPVDLQSCYRAIPSVQELIQHSVFQSYPIAPHYLTEIIRKEIGHLRQEISKGGKVTAETVPDVLIRQIESRLTSLFTPSLKRTINATGIILHTNMGRAPLAPAALQAIAETVDHYNNLEVDLGSGKRGSRHSHIEELLCMITGAEAALMVNNCAAAILLTLSTLCYRKEVPISRGELVEIGGAFRMPDVMKASNAKMVEIGTTNKTHLKDYENALGPKTGALLKVHTSNYRIVGFTKNVEISELAALAKSHQCPLVYDMGSGVIEDLQHWGYPHEPVVREILAAGVDVVTFSGDKILGGPQAGIIAGTKKYIEKIRKHPLTRAMRCDKLIYAAMEATLRLYLQPDKLPEKLPLAAMLNVSLATLRQRGDQLKTALAKTSLQIDVVATDSQMGSGALPLEKIPSVALKVSAAKRSPSRLAKQLRMQQPPITAYVQDGALLLNLRTIREDELPMVKQALAALGD